MTSMRRPYLRKIPAHELEPGGNESPMIWREILKRAVQPVKQLPGYRARREFFSLHHSVVDFRRMRATFDATDVVHLHWMVGAFDYDRAGEVLSDKPIVWTLADMNAFTGGCHYAEGCEEYKRECRDCPLLGGTSDAGARSLEGQEAAYAQLRRLHVICPSKWMAERARSSSLLGDRPVHYIPNAFPIDRFESRTRPSPAFASACP